MPVLHSERREHFLEHPRRAFSLGAALLGIFVALALLVPAQPLTVEQHWADWMRGIETPLLDHVALIFNYLGRGLGRAPGARGDRRRSDHGAALVGALAYATTGS